VFFYILYILYIFENNNNNNNNIKKNVEPPNKKHINTSQTPFVRAGS